LIIVKKSCQRYFESFGNFEDFQEKTTKKPLTKVNSIRSVGEMDDEKNNKTFEKKKFLIFI